MEKGGNYGRERKSCGSYSGQFVVGKRWRAILSPHMFCSSARRLLVSCPACMLYITARTFERDEVWSESMRIPMLCTATAMKRKEEIKRVILLGVSQARKSVVEYDIL